MSARTALASALAVLLAALIAAPVLAQDYELESSLEGFPEDETFSARMVGDYVVVADDDYCRMLIGATFGPTAKYLPEKVLGKARKTQQANLTRFAEPGDANTAVCAGVLQSLGGTVLPESLAALLPTDSAGEPQAPSGEGLTFQDSGTATTDYFRLAGGLYLAMVENAACESWAGTLMYARGEPALAEPLSASNLLEDIEPGLYYWKVEASDCDWSVTILPEQQ